MVYSGSRSPKWILNASRAFVQPRVRVHCGTAIGAVGRRRRSPSTRPRSSPQTAARSRPGRRDSLPGAVGLEPLPRRRLTQPDRTLAQPDCKLLGQQRVAGGERGAVTTHRGRNVGAIGNSGKRETGTTVTGRNEQDPGSQTMRRRETRRGSLRSPSAGVGWGGEDPTPVPRSSSAADDRRLRGRVVGGGTRDRLLATGGHDRRAGG